MTDDLLSACGRPVFTTSGRSEAEILALQDVAFGKIDCAGCTKCCRGEAVYLTVHDDPSLYETVPVEIKPGRYMPTDTIALQLPHKPNGDCHYLGETGCTIYERRPHICKLFDCRMYVAGMKARYTRVERRQLAKAMGQKSLIDTRVWAEGERRLSAMERSK